MHINTAQSVVFIFSCCGTLHIVLTLATQKSIVQTYFWHALPRSDTRCVQLTFNRGKCWGNGDTRCHHFIAERYLEHHKISPQESVPIHQFMQAESKDGSSSTVSLYINSRIVCGLFCSWPCVPTLKIRSDMWDRVESYAIHMFLAYRLKITFTSNLKLIIYFLVYSYQYFHPSSHYHLLPQLGMLHMTSRVYLRLANRPSAQF